MCRLFLLFQSVRPSASEFLKISCNATLRVNSIAHPAVHYNNLNLLQAQLRFGLLTVGLTYRLLVVRV